MNGKISIIVPCYNQSLFLEDCFNSIYTQSYDNWECLIINDGSTDNTEEIALTWVEKDNRFKYFYKKNGGLSTARNTGLEHATGEFIKFLDNDDFLYPDSLIKSIVPLESADITITSFNHFAKGKFYPGFCELKQEYLNFENILLQWDDAFSIPIHCAVFKKSLFENVRFIEQIKSGEDWVMWLTVYKNNPKTIFINEVLVCYREHERSITKDPKNMIYEKLNAQMYIFETLLDDTYKKLYFKRFSLEALNRRYAFMYVKKKKSIFKKITGLFKKK